MKDLIKEILLEEKLHCYNDQYKDGFNEDLDKAIEIIKQHNIITAPKSIKLSEIVDRLKKDFPTHDFYYRYVTKSKWIAIWLGNHCYATFTIKDNKLVLENKDEFEYPKWLYTLWIAGTEIIDDLEAIENE